MKQAKDVPEDVILRVLNEEPGRWHTHRRSMFMASLPEISSELAAFPEKVLLAKLRGMLKRGVIDGCGCGCRGDWRVPSPEERRMAALGKAVAEGCMVVRDVTVHEANSEGVVLIDLTFEGSRDKDNA